MAYSHCRIRTRIRTRTRIPNPMDTLYYAEGWPLSYKIGYSRTMVSNLSFWRTIRSFSAFLLASSAFWDAFFCLGIVQIAWNHTLNMFFKQFGWSDKFPAPNYLFKRYVFWLKLREKDQNKCTCIYGALFRTRKHRENPPNPSPDPNQCEISA